MRNRSTTAGFRCVPLTPLLSILVLTLVSCATNRRAYSGIDKAVEVSTFKKGVELIDEAQKSNKPIYPKKNQILLYLDRGLLAHYADMYQESTKDLGQAERLIEEAFTKSLSADLASYILNDNTKEYAGEDYENIYLNVFNALNYYYMGSLDDALVEVRRTNEKLRVLAQEYDKINSEMREKYKNNLSGVNLPAAKPVNFNNSALADYLGALFYRADGAYDDARINLLQLRDAFITAPNVYQNPIPASLVLSGEEGSETAEELQLPKNEARVNILCFTGLSPAKEENDISFPLPFEYGLDLAHLRLPELVPRIDTVTSIELVTEAGKKIELELLEDMGKAVQETFNAKYNTIFLKTLIRVIVKYTSVYAISKAAAESSGNETAGTFAALAAKLTFDATERADIRMERYLPAKAWIGAVNLEPGTHTITINYYSGPKKIGSEERTIQAETGRLNLLEGICLR
ncbi:MAG: hypothetical protein LBD44_00045 [Spirochaetaceae bacterium]|jgi:hypothetical protein|nr:hypothetical protein [Spirochaetaceae bacterium]